MLGFYDNLKSKKELYFNSLINKALLYENVIIYGAGRVAVPVYNKLSEKNIEIKCFVVSDKNINDVIFMGKDVIQIDELKYEPEKTFIIIATKYIWADEISKSLQNRQYIHYEFPPKEIDYFAREQSDWTERPIMEITVKTGCIVNCKYCPQELFIKSYFEKENRPEYLTFENYKKCLEKLPQNTIIDFCGFAEPFINPDAVEMIKYTFRKGYDMRLFTTLVGLKLEGYEQIKDIPFLYVVLHTPDQEEYAKIPMTTEYFEILDRMLEQKKPDGSKFIDTANCQSRPHKAILEHTKGKLRIQSQLYDRAGNIKDDVLFEPINNIDGKIYCTRVNHKLDYNVMLPDGTVVLCNYDFGLKHVLGNLLDNSYEKIMNGNEMRKIEDSLNNDKCELLCRKCNYAWRV